MSASRLAVVFAVVLLAGSSGLGRALAGELAADALDLPFAEGHLSPADLSAGHGGAGRLAPGAEPRTPPVFTDGVLHLAWIDPVDAVGGCAAGAREEAARVFKAIGIPVQWRRGAAGEPDRAGEIRVILLDRAVRRDGRTVVLGATPARFEARPFVWIHVPGVREAVRVSGPRVTALEMAEQHRLGVALGRVIAHEVVHSLAPGMAHGQGLMAPRLSSSDLTAAALPVAPEVSVAVRAALSEGGPRPVPAPDAGLLAAEHVRR